MADELKTKTLMIEFIKVAKIKKELSLNKLSIYEKELEKVKDKYEIKILGIRKDQNYIEYNKIIESTENIDIIKRIQAERDNYYLRKIRKIEKEREKAIRELDNRMFGNDGEVIQLVKSFDTDFDIKCIYGFSEDEKIIKRSNLMESLKTVHTKSINYCPFLLLEIYRLRDRDTHKEQLKIIVKSCENEENELVSIYSSMSELEKNLMGLIDYGTELGRQELIEIRKIIRMKYADIKIINTDLGDELKLSHICEYINEKQIKKTIVNANTLKEKSLYLIPSEDFDEEFRGYKNTTELIGKLIKDGIIIANRGRCRYKYNGRYYIAINADKVKDKI